MIKTFIIIFIILAPVATLHLMGKLILDIVKWTLIKPIKHYLKMHKLAKQTKIHQKQRRRASKNNAEFCMILSKMINNQQPRAMFHHF